MTPRRDNDGVEPVIADRSGVGFLLNQAARSLRAQLAEDLRHHDLTDTDFIVLRIVVAEEKSNPGGVPVSDISAELNIPVGQISGSAERLVRLGWLETSRAGGALRCSPTQKARTVVPGIAGTARWTLERALNGFSRDEILTLQDMLERIIKNTGAAI